MKILVTTNPFGSLNREPIELLSKIGSDIGYNNTGREYEKQETLALLKRHNPEIIIAGTEKYDAEVLDASPNLKLISRVGIGLDSVDLEECKKRGIVVTNTPSAPSNAVAEVAVGQMISMLRRVQEIDLRKRAWDRYIGKEIRSCKIGIIGCGRIGTLVYQKIKSFEPRAIFTNDLVKEREIERSASKDEILAECDVVTVHIPLDKENYHFIKKGDFDIMKKDAVFLNFARGGIVNEDDLCDWLTENKDARAAIDNFEKEPYSGKLMELENCYLTPHIGSCSAQSRRDMEVGAVNNAIHFLHSLGFALPTGVESQLDSVKI